MWLKRWSGVDRPRQVTQRSPWTQVKIKHLLLYRLKGILSLLLTDELKFLLIQKLEFRCVSNFPPPPPTRGLMSRYYGRKSFWFKQSFLTETAICFVKRWKKEWATVLFLCAILHRKVIPDNFFVFFPVIFTRPRLLRSRNFATRLRFAKKVVVSSRNVGFFLGLENSHLITFEQR